jgi:glycosyltransferase involved in cell wall biosynthesis
VTEIQDDDIEIIVSDNASTDGTREVVESFKDSRMSYISTKQRVSMRMNFELAFNRCSGDYVICFGDDDGIIPGQFSILKDILKERCPNAVSWSLPVYGWPVSGYGKKWEVYASRSPNATDRSKL